MRIVLLSLASLVVWANVALAQPARYTIDPEHATVAFLVKHIGYARTLGQFLTVEGGFTYDDAARSLSDLTVTIDAVSVFTNHRERDDHVRNPDFLDTPSHPAITFVGTGAEATGEDTGLVHGDLTIRGVTRPVTLEVTRNKQGPYPWGENYVLGVSARTTIQRSAFGMTYALEGGLVGDDLDIIIEIEAIRQPVT